MKRTILSAIVIAGVAGSVAVPTIVSGNARREDGSLAAAQQAETPYLASLSGANELSVPGLQPNAGDGDGSGAAAITFAAANADEYEVCFDLSYGGIADPTAAHIHVGDATVNGAVVVGFGDPPAGSHHGCQIEADDVIEPILANPAGFYVNIHTAEFPNGALRGQLSLGTPPAGAPHFLPSPLRAYDSRSATAGIMAAGTTRTVSLGTGVDLANARSLAVPPGATAAIVTLTATQTGGPGFLTIYSDSATQPATSNLNFTAAGQTVAVSTQVAVDEAGEIKVTAGPAATHVIVDVVGYLY